MLHCLNTSGNHLQTTTTTTTTCSSDMTVLERQRSRMKWQHEQEEEHHHQDYFCGNALGEVVEVAHKMKPDPGGFEREMVSLSPMCGKKENTSRGKRKKTDTNNNNKDRNSKRNKVSVEEDGESKITDLQTCSKGSSEAQVQKPDYIHVRARRGQATDSHSLAERVRREKISERMKYLQDLVPGCNKIAGKAGMLDEIINYVQSLQRQVEFLSMKLATVNTRLDFNIDELFTKEVFPQSFPTIGMPSDMTNNHAYLQAQQLVSCYGGLVNNIAAPVSFPETLLDTSFFNNILPSSNWEGDFQNLHNNVNFDQGRLTTSFPTQPFTGLIEASNLKMEM